MHSGWGCALAAAPARPRSPCGAGPGSRPSGVPHTCSAQAARPAPARATAQAGTWALGLSVETELRFVPAPRLENFFYVEEGLLELREDEVNLELTKEAELSFKTG